MIILKRFNQLKNQKKNKKNKKNKYQHKKQKNTCFIVGIFL
ncbi:hypothetical protein HMPREF1871_00881 [Gemelliphila asaccharolytica]|uniref:Uncharacterized protein n=1 Tax=Gemelliphila asaccharolytica TaxID=502393 RepID=A0ABR5TL81_9BACL|nr:hypothetical protein HMPREF1871_00881 [Gemella asaccharolytica]